MHLVYRPNNVSHHGNLHVVSTPVDPNFDPIKITLTFDPDRTRVQVGIKPTNVIVVESLGTAPRSRMFIVCFNDYKYYLTTFTLDCTYLIPIPLSDVTIITQPSES